MAQYMLGTVSYALRGQGLVATRLLEHRPSELCIDPILSRDCASAPRQDDRRDFNA
jgi:hypothetical protein